MILLYFDTALKMLAKGIIHALSEMGLIFTLIFIIIMAMLVYIDKEENKK